MQSTRCTGRSIDHSTAVICPAVRGFIAFFRARNFSSSSEEEGGGDRLRIRASIVATNEEGTSLPHSFCSSIAVVSDDRSIQIAPFHDREPLCPPREMFDGASAAEEQAANFFSTDLSIVRRRWCCGRNKQVSHAQWQCCGTRETTRFTSGF